MTLRLRIDRVQHSPVDVPRTERRWQIRKAHPLDVDEGTVVRGPLTSWVEVVPASLLEQAEAEVREMEAQVEASNAGRDRALGYMERFEAERDAARAEGRKLRAALDAADPYITALWRAARREEDSQHEVIRTGIAYQDALATSPPSSLDAVSEQVTVRMSRETADFLGGCPPPVEPEEETPPRFRCDGCGRRIHGDAERVSMAPCSTVFGDECAGIIRPESRVRKETPDEPPQNSIAPSVEELLRAGVTTVPRDPLPSTTTDERREGLCERCARDYPVWVAPNALWNRVIRAHGGDGYGEHALRDHFLCPLCFALLAEERGTKPTAWVLAEEGPQMWDLLTEGGAGSPPAPSLRELLTSPEAVERELMKRTMGADGAGTSHFSAERAMGYALAIHEASHAVAAWVADALEPRGAQTDG